jgi:hypothetical protein
MKRVWMPARPNGRSLRAWTSLVLLPAVLSACGGGLESDSGGQASRLTCATTCKPSSSLATDQIRPSFVVVSDGTRAQAQAGFSSGSDFRFNVEIDGTDSLRLSTTQGTQGFHIPAGSLSTVVVDALRTLVAGATPYLSELTPVAGTLPVQFQFVRGSTTYASSVELPAPFQITAPASGTTVPIATRRLSVALTSATAPTVNSATFACTDVNGNTATGSPTLNVVPGSLASTASGVSYALDVGEAVDGLTFSTNFPRSAVARCDLKLQLIVQAQGQADTRFADTQIFAQQIRSVTLAMR